MVTKSSPSDDPPSEQSIAEQWRRELSDELRAFAEPAVGRRLPKSLSSIKSDYERLCEKHGGPAEIEGFERVKFEWSCDKYRLRRFEHLLNRWQPDPATGVRHWHRFLTILTGRNLPKIRQGREPEPIINRRFPLPSPSGWGTLLGRQPKCESWESWR
jgi:hypothetical protein